MPSEFGVLETGGSLDAVIIHGRKDPEPKRVRSMKIPGLGRVWFTRDLGESILTGKNYLMSRLMADHYHNGKLVERCDLGSGLTTQALALALANESVYGATSAPLGRLTATATSYFNSGTGTTAAAASDWTLQTTNAPTTAISTSTIAASADNVTITLVGTLAYGGTFAITEWGYFNQSSIAAVNSTSANAFTSSTYTPTSSPSWTVNAEIGYVIIVGATPTNVSSPTMGLIVSNISTAATIGPSWVNVTSGGGSASTPSSNTAAALYPIMGDHKVFSALNVVSGDSIAFTYVLTISSGG